MSSLWRRLKEENGWGRVWSGLAIAICLAGGGLVYQTYADNSGTTETANLWVDTNGGTCTRQSTAGAYSDAGACSSFDAAYSAASLGDIVLVRSGAYSVQTITDESGKDTTGDEADVTIQPETAGTVTVSGLALGTGVLNTDGPDHLTISDISDSDLDPDTCGGWAIFGDSNDVTFDNIKTCNFYINTVTGSGASVTVASGLTIENSEFTGCTTVIGGGAGGCDNIKIDGTDNFVFSGNYVHDFRIVQGSGAHFECMFLSDATNVTIEGNRFENCEFFDILVQRCAPANGGRCLVSGLTFQNNWFDQPWDGTGTQGRTGALAFSPRNTGFSNVLIRFNSFNGGTGISVNDDDDGSTYSNFRIIGNLIGVADCEPSATQDYNIFLGGSTCGTNATTASAASVYVDSAHLQSSGDWHLKTGTNGAVDFVTPTSSDYALTDDIDGDTRPVGSARDAGSDER
jgi:hypothetical protein